MQSIEFFLAKEVTHFVTDKSIEHSKKTLQNIQQFDTNRGSPLSQLVVTPKTPITPNTPKQKTGSSHLLVDLSDCVSPNGTPNDARVTLLVFVFFFFQIYL